MSRSPMLSRDRMSSGETTSSRETLSSHDRTDPSIRPARAADLDGVLELLSNASLPRDGVRDSFGEGWVIAADGDRVIGVVGIELHGEDGLLRSAAIDVAWRGRGIGQALTRDRIGWARGRGLRALYLLTETAPAWFTRFGFEAIDRADVPEPIRSSSEFSSVCPEAAVVMRLVLERELRDVVRERYGAAAKRAAGGDQASCCGPSCCGGASSSTSDPITSDLYDSTQTTGLPETALLASLGCGNPTALAELRAGEVVLDLGSGGGIDVLLSARRVGPTGHAYGLDMTDEMLALARENQRRAGAHNVEFLKGQIEDVPLPDASVDVIISNCVINLSADKARVLREAFRVLRPGGRFAVSDIVVRGAMPAAIRASMEAWTGCIAGALEENEYRELLASAGFEAIDIEPTRVYTAEHARALLEGTSIDARLADQVDGRFMSAFVRATKPVA